MAFQQGLSGLSAASKNLEVIGNNVSNANTIGFKASGAQFSDVFASSVNGAGGTTVGIGTKLSSVKQNFTQGNISVTNNPLDLAINGQGFYKVKNALGDEIYTRNGQFSLDGQGFVVNSSGDKLLGYGYDPVTKLQLDTTSPVQLPQRPIAPKGTSTSSLEVNLDARKTAPPATTPFDVTDLTSYNDTTSMAVYDQLGGSHTMSVYYRRDPAVAGVPSNTWQVYATIDGAQTPAAVPPAVSGAPVGTLSFDPNGVITTGTPTTLTIPVAGLATSTSSFANNITLDMSKTTQYGSGFQVNNLSQDGYQSSAFSSFTVAPDGKITARYVNGQSSDLAKIGLFNFRSPEALQPIGANGWLRTDAAGPEFTPKSDDTAFGKIQSGALEEANLDLTAELVDMITAQRVYQANAQTIKTQDSVLQTLVNLR